MCLIAAILASLEVGIVIFYYCICDCWTCVFYTLLTPLHLKQNAKVERTTKAYLIKFLDALYNRSSHNNSAMILLHWSLALNIQIATIKLYIEFYIYLFIICLIFSRQLFSAENANF